MFLLLELQNDKFILQERDAKNIPETAIYFFDFQKRKDITGENLIKVTALSITELHDLALRGLITQEAKEKIKELLKIN